VDEEKDMKVTVGGGGGEVLFSLALYVNIDQLPFSGEGRGGPPPQPQ
jgi:hypothetical protein